MSLYDKTVQFVDTAFGRKQTKHFERTVFWLEKFQPDITEAHRIAAYAHDIERAFRDASKRVPEDYLDLAFLKYHSEMGAEIIAQFLLENEAGEGDIRKVKHLISKREVGGDTEQNALMAADSVSFFESNAEMFVREKAPVEGREKIRGKFDWMFNRISTEERKAYALANYEKWSKELEKMNQ